MGRHDLEIQPIKTQRKNEQSIEKAIPKPHTYRDVYARQCDGNRDGIFIEKFNLFHQRCRKNKQVKQNQ